jgi:hypothetical protein
MRTSQYIAGSEVVNNIPDVYPSKKQSNSLSKYQSLFTVDLSDINSVALLYKLLNTNHHEKNYFIFNYFHIPNQLL